MVLCVSTQQLIDSWVVSRFRILLTKLLWLLMYKSVRDICFYFSWFNAEKWNIWIIWPIYVWLLKNLHIPTSSILFISFLERAVLKFHAGVLCCRYVIVPTLWALSVWQWVFFHLDNFVELYLSFPLCYFLCNVFLELLLLGLILH